MLWTSFKFEDVGHMHARGEKIENMGAKIAKGFWGKTRRKGIKKKMGNIEDKLREVKRSREDHVSRPSMFLS